MVMMGQKLALYFGCSNVSGHSLHAPPYGHSCSLRSIPGFPWDYTHLDTTLLINRKVPDVPDGRVHWTCGGKPDLWFAFFWWDRSGDKRSNSNSGFYVRGFGHEAGTKEAFLEAVPRAFEYACEQWPDIVARQNYKLKLVLENEL